MVNESGESTQLWIGDIACTGSGGSVQQQKDDGSVHLYLVLVYKVFNISIPSIMYKWPFK